MSDYVRQVQEAADFVGARSSVDPAIGIILGTGLGSLADGIEVSESVEYDDIPHFPVSTVETHHGRLLLGRLGGKPVVAMQGRFHFYEGYSMREVTFPIRVMHLMGVRTLVVSNACGGVNPQFANGDIVTITDHINLLGDNPLMGPNLDEFGPRFPDMYNCYDRELLAIAEQVALELGIRTQRGVYAAVPGPNLETAAEYRYIRIIGADVVGMSTVPEVIVARHQSMKVAGFSIVTDMGLPDALGPVNIDEIIATAKSAEPNLKAIIAGLVERMPVPAPAPTEAPG